MRLDFPNYRILVLAEFDRKRRSGGLPLSLLQPTPGRIRSECAKVYQERFETKDELALRNFFGVAEAGLQYLEWIENFPIDKFRPLTNYLTGGTERTDVKNLELLAWLINFRHRPYWFAKEVLLTDEEMKVLEGEAAASKQDRRDMVKGLSETDEDGSADSEEDDDMMRQGKLPDSDGLEKEKRPDSPTSLDVKDTVELSDTAIRNTDMDPGQWSATAERPSGNVEPADTLSKVADRTASRYRIRNLIIACLITAICTSGIVAHWMSKDSGCMYWANDHYEKIACDADTPVITKLPLEKSKMKNFRRILNEETITEDMVGKIYYVRINGKIEYYTSFGYHPIDNTRTAKVLTQYMFDKHLRKVNLSNKKIP